MVNKRHIWAQPSTHDGRHANMLGADVVRCNQYMVPQTRYQIKYDLLNLVLSAIVTNNSSKRDLGASPLNTFLSLILAGRFIQETTCCPGSYLGTITIPAQRAGGAASKAGRPCSHFGLAGSPCNTAREARAAHNTQNTKHTKNGDNDDDHHDGRSWGYDLLSPYHLGTTVAMHIPRRRRPIIRLPAPRIPSPFQGWIARPTRRHIEPRHRHPRRGHDIGIRS